MTFMNSTAIAALLAGFFFSTSAYAQEAQPETDTASEAAEQVEDSDADAAELLTQAELEKMVAPVALYPDTLLIQILVASTYPLEVVKGAQFVAENGELSEEDMKAGIEDQKLDPSVTVLATAFPTVLAEMSDHIDWTENLGTAMLAQSDDVMNAVQTLRDQAVESGALVSGEQQLVEADDDGNVVIVPADPEVVYVPVYEPDSVWDDVGDVVIDGLIIWTTYTVIDDIFDNDDDWFVYWGCRNCGGWGGRPIIHRPDIDIDIDGNANIGNNIDVDRDNDIGWKPEEKRAEEARGKIADHRSGEGEKLPLDSRPDRGDDLRKKLSDQTGAADISDDKVRENLPKQDAPKKEAPKKQHDAGKVAKDAAPAGKAPVQEKIKQQAPKVNHQPKAQPKVQPKQRAHQPARQHAPKKQFKRH